MDLLLLFHVFLSIEDFTSEFMTLENKSFLVKVSCFSSFRCVFTRKVRMGTVFSNAFRVPSIPRGYYQKKINDAIAEGK